MELSVKTVSAKILNNEQCRSNMINCFPKDSAKRNRSKFPRKTNATHLNRKKTVNIIQVKCHLYNFTHHADRWHMIFDVARISKIPI